MLAPNSLAAGFAVVDEAYDIAFDYLRLAGAIPPMFGAHEQLLDVVVDLYCRGERNKIRLANRAIAAFQNARRC
ncbi:hypothetical protein NP284_20945 [Rhodopseudomonas pseudopalustris]|uniref:hypothetical protein n=1 Tax=Rhodopseudomonas pseudopalustris TaxID=1513892 RepID=UPI003F9872BD